MNYEYTQTFKPQLFCYPPEEQYLRTYPLMQDILRDVKSTIICEFTNEENIHFHCMVEVKTPQIKTMILNRIRKHKICGRKTFVQVQYEQSYRDYLIKDLDKTQKLLPYYRNPIIRDGFGVKWFPEEWEEEMALENAQP